MNTSTWVRSAVTGLGLAMLAGTALAHPGHGPHTWWDMFTHAFGMEQLLVLAGLGVGYLAWRRWRANRRSSPTNKIV
jgi:hypothetical protein